MSNNVRQTCVDNSTVQEMYEKAMYASGFGAFSVRSTVHALPSMVTCSKEENYMLAEFTNSNEMVTFSLNGFPDCK